MTDEAAPKPQGASASARPRDAASLILIDRSGKSPHVLVGRRGRGHVFMPDFYVFPGGRRDGDDSRLPFAGDLDAAVLAKLMTGPPAGISARRARALALAALRETREETGLGREGPADLSRLRFVARAITPPGLVRRYDTRFFLTFADESGFDLGQLRPSPELDDLRWLDIHAVSGLKLPRITLAILEDVRNLMASDLLNDPKGPVSFHFTRHGRSIRSHL